MIDTHCHLYSEELVQDIEAVLRRAEAAGIQKFYLPAIDCATTEKMLQLEEHYPGKCFAMIGLHPCSVKEDYLTELKHIEQLLQQRSFAGIGETGLDFYWDTTYKAEQYAALEKQIEWALQYKLPLILHTRNAMQETIDVVKRYKGTGLRGIFHCFGGTTGEARQVIDCGFLLGIGGVVTYKNSGLPAVLEQVSPEHLVLETDAPYLAPVPYRGKRNESSYMTETARKLAAIYNVTPEEIDRITTANAEKCFAKAV